MAEQDARVVDAAGGAADSDSPAEAHAALAFRRSLGEALREQGGTPSVSPDVIRLFPPDLTQALREEKAQYKPRMLQRADGVHEVDGLLALTPTPAADPDWDGGTMLGFARTELVFAGEVVHLDPSKGELFVEPSSSFTAAAAAKVERWCFKPFDFADAICNAALSLVQSAELPRALERVQGRELSPGGDEQKRASDPGALWPLPWGLLWGPPGTGKTHAIGELLCAEVERDGSRRILAVAPTNRAVDELTLRVAVGLEKRGALFRNGACQLFRGGVGAGRELASRFPGVVRDEAYKRMIEEIELRKAAVQRLESGGASPASVASAKAEVRRLQQEVKDETTVAVQHGRAAVVFLTVHRALRLVADLVGKAGFWKLVIDEGGMVSRAASALLAPLASTVLVAGDPKQIGPVSRAAEGASLGVRRWLRASALSHLDHADRDARAEHVHLLRVQHRMHPDIARLVSAFAYSGQLQDGPRPLELARTPRAVNVYPERRAVWVVLDESGLGPRDLCHDRPTTGRGYIRRASAQVAVTLAKPALECGLTVFAATPYRAQAALLRNLGSEEGYDERFVASTIHRQQGAEYDVVILDTVAGGRPFQPGDLTAMLNVVASRARHQLFVLSSRSEAQGAIPSLFLSHCTRLRASEKDTIVLAPASSTHGRKVEFVPPETLGGEVANLRTLQPLFTAEQQRLFERKFGDGHQLIRGVAGSGKTPVLAHWATRFLQSEPQARALVSYFNKALEPLVRSLLEKAISERMGPALVSKTMQRVTVTNVDALMHLTLQQAYDAVFVDEAQDMRPKQLRFLHDRARPFSDEGGESRRRLFLFMDDSQNVYGNKPVDEFREGLGEGGLRFTGRTSVMKEAFRSSRQILDLAFNVALDPLDLHRVKNPGMRQFMKSNELAKAELLRRPAETADGLYHVEYTERSGAVPTVLAFPSESAEAEGLAREIRRLVIEEHVRPADILVAVPARPERMERSIMAVGMKALAIGGRRGVSTSNFPLGDVDFVRVTTIFSAKGHECPVVFFGGAGQLDKIEDILQLDGRGPDDIERTRRSLFYVAATRAMARQYITGVEASRFMSVARAYAEVLAGRAAG